MFNRMFEVVLTMLTNWTGMHAVDRVAVLHTLSSLNLLRARLTTVRAVQQVWAFGHASSCSSPRLRDALRLNDAPGSHDGPIVEHRDRVWCAALHPANENGEYPPQLLASGGEKGEILIWDMSTMASASDV